MTHKENKECKCKEYEQLIKELKENMEKELIKQGIVRTEQEEDEG